MAGPVIERRSQAILRLPVDHLPASLVLHDGTRSDVTLFVPAGETVPSILTGAAFLPIIRGQNVVLVARAAVACLAVPDAPPSELDGVLPEERQRAVVHLLSGVTLAGELRWIPPAGRQRTVDHLNLAVPYFTMHADGLTHYVLKAHVAFVEEK